jgi:hypothetical protein
VLQAGPALTADVLATAKDARWLANDQGLLEIPLHLGGRLTRISLQPDPEFVASLLGRILMGGRKGEGTDGKDLRGSIEDALRGLQRQFRR